MALSDLRTRFYARFDEGAQNYIGVPEANALINEGASHLHNWIVAEGEAYVWQETTLPLVKGQMDYPLPATLLKLLKVFAQSSYPANGAAGNVRALPRLMPQEYRGGAITWGHMLPTHAKAYMLLGQSLRVLPTPQANPGALTLWWAPIWQNLVADTDTTPLVMFPGAEEFIVNQATIAARLKEESDTTALERRQQQIQQMIQQTLINRDMGQHSRVVDSEGMVDGWES